jgi:poly-gamma-glutamate capsule biosynthesis protein CapA/YwtB (metallophosphatase superfamily)
MADHRIQTVDDDLNHRPRFTVHRLVFLFCLLLAIPTCQPRQAVILALLGDINLGRGVTPSADSLAYLTSYLSAADLALANLESPLSGSSDPPVTATGGYNLCASADRAAFLADWDLDLLSLANNHQNDCTPDGIPQTRSILTGLGLTGLGSQPVTLQVDGLTLAFFAFDDVSTPLDADAAAKSIGLAHEDGALVIVSIHWGMEYQGGPSDRQKALARQFAAAGAALIWGHHPHVLQPAEWIQPPAGSEHAGGSTLVLYSLGNALFDQGGLNDTRRSALALVTLDADGVTAVQAIPFEIDVVHSRLVAPEAETAEKILERLNIAKP